MAQDKRQDGGLYFAYGSNLSTTQMQQRCPLSTPIGLAHLGGWTWIINERGYANIVENGHHQDQHPATDGAADQNESHDGDTSWDGKSEITPGPGVYGLVYRLHPLDEATLNEYEGVPDAYERKMLDFEWVAAGATDEKIQVLVYVDFKRITPSAPKEEYIGRMNVGIEEAVEKWELPVTYVEDVMRPFIPAPGN
ncbi:hypothetical protein HD806DRAFT_523166 [Xylariaceae sp. AK1471]|nr:hypothetical protein HD806DRAFT_523166 [Xylariaceae sp. AK1471]